MTAELTAFAALVAPAVTFVMSGNPHVPLAVVHGAAIESAVAADQRGTSCGDRQRWAKAHSAWQAVDVWGHVRGTYRIGGSELYDVTACREVSFAPPAPPAPADGTMVYIAADSAWREPPSAEWTPTPAQRASLVKLANGLEGGRNHGVPPPSEVAEIAESVRFFVVPAASAAPGATTPMAVAGRCGGWLVASWVQGAWRIVSRELQEKRTLRECYRPLAVFDLNGDGTAEIILRFTEGGGEWWGEQVLQRSAAGTWTQVALSPGGSTA